MTLGCACLYLTVVVVVVIIYFLLSITIQNSEWRVVIQILKYNYCCCYYLFSVEHNNSEFRMEGGDTDIEI